jgi:hypothetical protein
MTLKSTVCTFEYAQNKIKVLGFCEAITNPSYQSAESKFDIAPKLIAGAAAASFSLHLFSIAS